MSRCFPYPPPGYTLSRARNEALIESIKLQKEKQKTREKKEKRKERKERRKEKKDKRKERRKEKKDKTSQNLDKSDIGKGHIGQKICLDTKGEFLLHRRREAETEQLERSSLTEEHAHPVSLPVPSSSSNSTENSNKRKRHSSPIDGSHGHGKVILIRLTSKKLNKFDALAKEQQLCSISGRTDFLAQNKDDTGLRDRPENFCCTSKGTSNIGQGFSLRTTKEQICSTSGQIEAVAPGKTGIKPMPNNAVVTSMQRVELQCKNLLENWFPPQLQDACLYPDDVEWLFQGRNQDIRSEKRQRSGSDSISCSRSSALWPRAEYLHDGTDAYALPFTVPY
ncbi:hypothetical protein Pfo_017079 [Paulownia fortunei]|nr:hypothetical protein Pfo_017079 [Paulownia fortunei]